MRFEDFLTRFEGVTGSNGQWHARCPAHEDRQASLTIAVGREGQWLLTCWAGCSLDAIVRAVGMSVRDLFPSESDKMISTPSERVSLADAALPTAGEIGRYAERLQRNSDVLAQLFEAKGWRAGTCAVLELGLVGERISIPLRALDGKLVNFLRYSPNGHGKGPKMLAERGYPRAPFYAIVDDVGPVWIVEGEPDAISVANAGLNVIGAPGASAKVQPAWLAVVRDRDVIVCMDADDAGRKAAERWAQAAVAAGARSVRVVELVGPKGYDVGELVRDQRHDGGSARAKLIELAAAAPSWEAAETIAAPVIDSVDDDDEVERMEPGSMIARSARHVRLGRVHWLWRERIPRARVGIVFGPPGQGKSTLLALLIADVTRAGGRVLIASAEDDPATTILPRLIVAGAVIDNVVLLSTKAAKGETNLLLPRDNDALGAMMQGCALCLIDPLAAHLGDDVNSWSEQSIRALVLAPLAWWARKADCTVVAIMHLNKSAGTDALSRISGSGGFGGAARFALLLGGHPDDVGKPDVDTRQVLVHVKASEGPRRDALVFRRRMVGLELDDDVVPTPVLELVGEEAVAAESVLAATDPDEAGAFSEAVEWLQRELIDGAKPAKRLLAAARERGDFSERTLRKAKRALRVKSVREQDGWYWEGRT